jgi:hypothetical protein
MLKIEYLQPEPHVPWKIDGTVLAVGEEDERVEIDLAERESDSQVVIDICRCSMGLMEGACGEYVLSVEIPPRRYREEESEASGVENGGMSSGAGMILVPEPLDLASVTVRLWTDAGRGVETPETESHIEEEI